MLPVYRGVKHQYGYGLGSIFKTALKTVTSLIKPMVKSEFNAIKKEGLKQGIRAAEDIFLRGKNPKKVAISRGKQSIRDLAQQLKSVTGINKKEIKGNQAKTLTGHFDLVAVRSFLREKNTGDQEFLIYLIKNRYF